MQFFQIAALFLTVTGVSASPSPAPAAMDMEPFHIYARSCGGGLLRGTALSICQKACKVACKVIPIPAASAACAASCDQAPVNKRDEELSESDIPVAAAAAAELATQAAAEVAAEAAAAAEPELEARHDAEVDAAAVKAFTEGAELNTRDLNTREPAPITGGQICRGACAVTCNSTVLALIQKKCLSVCNGKCPN